MTRCYNTRHHTYKKYGARGIKVCQQWRNSFDAFLKDVGHAPTIKHSIDRVDNDGDYEPSNCRWATHVEQANNRRNNHFCEMNGVTMTIAQWCRKLDIRDGVVRDRLALGWAARDALTSPIAT